MSLSATELDLVDRWQRDFPLVSRPFEVVGRSVGLDERSALDVCDRLLQQKVLSRIGAVVRPHAVGASTLAALRVPPERLDDVAAIVSREPLVSHNYQRSHDYNLWFVIAGPDASAVAATIDSIERKTGLTVLNLPLLRAHHLDLGFSLRDEIRARQPRHPQQRGQPNYRLDAADRSLLAAIEDGLPLVAEPYREVAARTGLSEADVLQRLERLASAGVVTRFGCVVHHRSLGFTANAMVVWNVPDCRVDRVAENFTRHPAVTLCYQRPRRLPQWPYNLFCMIHAKSREEALQAVRQLKADIGAQAGDSAVLFSTRCFKQRGAVFSQSDQKVH